jgi:hypothetical protein
MMLFTPEEVQCLLICLKEYRNIKHPVLVRPLHMKLCNSCIRKLSDYSESTSFDAQEYSLMAFAIDCLITACNEAGDSYPNEYDSIFEKLQSLANT